MVFAVFLPYEWGESHETTQIIPMVDLGGSDILMSSNDSDSDRVFCG